MIPRALPWADFLWPFGPSSPLSIESVALSSIVLLIQMCIKSRVYGGKEVLKELVFFVCDATQIRTYFHK